MAQAASTAVTVANYQASGDHSLGSDTVVDQANTLAHVGGDIQDAAYQKYINIMNHQYTKDGVVHPTPSEIAAATAEYGIDTQRAVQILKSIGKSEDFMKSVVQALQ